MESKSNARVGYHRRNTENEIELSSLDNMRSTASNFEYHSQPQYTYEAVPQPLYDTIQPSDNIKSTKWLKVKTILASILATLLILIAISQSRLHYIKLGNSYTETVNTKSSAIGAIVAIYASFVTIVVRYCVSNVMILLTVYSLNTKGKYLLKARTWAYMITGKGPLYTSIPLFFAGLTATAIISVLPVRYLGSNHSVSLELMPSLAGITSCWTSSGKLVPNSQCTGVQSASSVMYSYTNSGNPFSSDGALNIPIGLLVGTNNSLGYPAALVNNRKAEIDKYDIIDTRYARNTAKTACVWTLVDTPMSCIPLNTTLVGTKYLMVSPFTNETYDSTASVHQGQDGAVRKTAEGTELAMIQSFVVFETGYTADGFVCISKPVKSIYGASTLTYQFVDFNTPIHVDAYLNSSCTPAYLPHSESDIYLIIREMLAGIFDFSSVDGSNVLINSFSTTSDCGYDDSEVCATLQFANTTTILDNGIGSLYSLIASQAYNVSTDEIISSTSTTVYGGPIRVTIGLQNYSPLQIWYCIVLVPIATFIISLFCPVNYLPKWDIINPIETLVAEAYIDPTITTAKDRTVAVRLGKLNGKIVATNRADLPHITE